MLGQQKLNNIELDLPEPDPNFKITDIKQYILDNIQNAYAMHLHRFRKAYALGKEFADKVTNET